MKCRRTQLDQYSQQLEHLSALRRRPPKVKCVTSLIFSPLLPFDYHRDGTCQLNTALNAAFKVLQKPSQAPCLLLLKKPRHWGCSENEHPGICAVRGWSFIDTESCNKCTAKVPPSCFLRNLIDFNPGTYPCNQSSVFPDCSMGKPQSMTNGLLPSLSWKSPYSCLVYCSPKCEAVQLEYAFCSISQGNRWKKGQRYRCTTELILILVSLAI